VEEGKYMQKAETVKKQAWNFNFSLGSPALFTKKSAAVLYKNRNLVLLMKHSNVVVKLNLVAF